jgi:uncharacterized protein (TIGR03067 family)
VGWLSVRLASGEHAEIHGDFLSIDNAAAKWSETVLSVKPGHEKELEPLRTKLLKSIGTVLSVKPGHTYGVRYTLPNYGDSKAGDLQTGKFTFTVIEKGAPRPKHQTAAELKKGIAWGTPDKNGLQVGVLLLPVNDGIPTSRLAPAVDPAEGDREALEGGWEGQSGERDGQAFPNEEIKKFRITIKGDRMLMIPGAEWTPLRIKLDPAKNLKVLYATPIEGPEKDKTLPIIYRLDQGTDTLKLCYDEKNGKAVPEDFAARKGSGLMLLVLKHERRPLAAPAARN